MNDLMTLPISPQSFWFFVALLGFLGLSALIYGALSGLGKVHRPPLWGQVGERWRFPTLLLGLLWLGLFFLTIAAAYVGVWQAIQPEGQAVQPGLGLGALLAALLGAPFVIWGTWLKYQTVRYQKEGHITDRINKAVEQLGAEKTVDRIGRPVTIWMGEFEEYEATGDAARSLMEKPRTKVEPKAWKGLEGAFEQAFDKQDLHLVRTWSSDRTVIEFKGEALAIAKDEVVGVEGTWDVFSETVPNIEVRIGAILSLERIAQDSTIHDKGRDHVRVMEVLCAYIRENSNARKPVDFPEPEWVPLSDGASEEERQAHEEKRRERFGREFSESKAWIWAQGLRTPRADVAKALEVIRRRNPKQRLVEAAWPEPPDERTIWPFERPCPRLPEEVREEKLPESELHSFWWQLREWKSLIDDYKGYQLDLSGANLQQADMSGHLGREEAGFAGALLTGARMEGANFERARLDGARLRAVRLEGANLRRARLEGAELLHAQLEGADLSRAQLVGAHFGGAWLVRASLDGALIEGAFFGGAQLDGAGLRNTKKKWADIGHTSLVGAEL